MANRKVLVCSSVDSNALSYIDLTDGSYNGVEFNHSEALSEVFKHNGDLYLGFDGSGSRIAKSLHDGQLAPENQDAAPTGWSAWPEPPSGFFSSSSDYLNESLSKVKIGTDLFIRADVPNDYYGTYSLVHGNDAVIHTFAGPGNTLNLVDAEVFPTQFENRGTIEMAFVGRNGSLVSNYLACNFAYRDGYFYAIAQTQYFDENNGNEHRVKIWLLKFTISGTITNGNGFADVILASKDLMVDMPYDASSTVYPGDSLFFTDSGNLVFQKSSIDNNTGNLYTWDGVTATLEVVPQSYPIYFIAEMLASNRTNRTEVNRDWDAPSDVVRMKFKKFDAATMTFTLVTSEYVPHAGAAGLSTNELGFEAGVYYMHVDNWHDGANVRTLYNRLVMFNEDGAVTDIDLLSKINVGRPCPVGESNFDNFAIFDLQPYKVEGYAKRNNVGVESDLILVDNASMRVIGRTKSDPTTGKYSFRCYNAGKKTVFARHPVTGGMRIAAEVIPTAPDEPDPDPSDWADSGEVWGDTQVPWN